jgi:hypothetical protein
MNYDYVFDKCVDLLNYGARKFGTTYKTINVVVFCVIWPAITVGLVAAVICLW